MFTFETITKFIENHDVHLFSFTRFFSLNKTTIQNLYIKDEMSNDNIFVVATVLCFVNFVKQNVKIGKRIKV